jgi:hypothetical protein
MLKRTALLVNLFLLLALGASRPPGGPGHEFVSHYLEGKRATQVYVKIGVLSFHYLYADLPGRELPMPGAVILETNDSGGHGHDFLIRCDNKEVLSAKGYDAGIPKEILEQIVNATDAEVELSMRDQRHVEKIGPNDEENLRRLLSYGAGWTAPQDVLQATGPVAYVIVPSPRMSVQWKSVGRSLREAIAQRTTEIDRTWLILAEDRLSFYPERTRGTPSSNSPRGQLELSAAIDAMPVEAAAPPKKPIRGSSIIGWADDRHMRTVVLLLADDLPAGFARAMIRRAQRTSVRVHTLWCGDQQMTASQEEMCSSIATGTGGFMSPLFR